MSSTLNAVLTSEVEDLLAFAEEFEELGIATSFSFNWKGYIISIRPEHTGVLYEDHDPMFEKRYDSLEVALNDVKEQVIKKVMKDIEKSK